MLFLEGASDSIMIRIEAAEPTSRAYAKLLQPGNLLKALGRYLKSLSELLSKRK